MLNQILRAGLAATVIAVASAGCVATTPSQGPPTVATPSPDSSLPFTVVVDAKETGQALGQRVENVVLRTDAEFETYRERLGLPSDHPLARSLRLDFTQQTGILVALPMQATLGPSLEVEVNDRDGAIDVLPNRVVKQGRRVPIGDTPMFGRPFKYLAIAATAKPVHFLPVVEVTILVDN